MTDQAASPGRTGTDRTEAAPDAATARLLPTGWCFCGCGQPAELGRFFVRWHDATAAAALRALMNGSVAASLVAAGFGPDRSVVQAAVDRAGWMQCPDCAYAAASAAKLQAHQCPAGPGGPGRHDTPAAVGPRPEKAAAPAPPAGTGPLPDAREAQGGPGAEADLGGATTPVTAARATPSPEAGSVLAETGAATQRWLPSPRAQVWKGISAEETAQLAAAAHQLLDPVRAPLVEGQELVLVLRAVERGRPTGAQWRRLMTVPRADLGHAGDIRADDLYSQLQALADRYLSPAGDLIPVPLSSGDGAPATLPQPAEGRATAPAPADNAPVPGDPPPTSTSGQAADDALAEHPQPGRRKPGAPRTKAAAPAAEAGGIAASGVATGLALPPLDDQLWKSIPLQLRTEVAGAGAHLLSGLRGGVLTAQENREVLYSLRAASSRRATPRHWHALLTASRTVFGDNRSGSATQLYAMLQRVAEEYLAPVLAVGPEKPEESTRGE